MITRVGDAYDVVFGREAELAAVDALLASAPQGFALLSIEGDPGIGKTTVWREALRRARFAGLRVLTTRPTQSEASLSLAGLADLFGDADDGLIDRLPAPQQDAFRAALLQTPTPSRGIDERALCAAVLSSLRLLAERGPVLVAVDDAQWLDTATARALGFAVRRLDTEQVAVLATVRTTAPHAPTFDHVAEPARRRTLRLGPLTVAALHEAIKLRTGRSLPRPVIVQLANASGGNPFHAIEIAAELGDQPLEAGRLPVPASLTDLIASRLRRLPAPTRNAVLAAALLSRPTTEMVDGGSLEPAERAGIVTIDGTHITFTHPLFASAIERHAGDAERRRVHLALAEALTDPEERARHAALGAEHPDEAIAGTLEAAAAMARSRGAPAASAELLELSIGLTPAGDGGARATRRVAAAASWFDAGDLTRAQTMLEEASAAASLEPSTRAHALELLGQLHARRSSFAQALAVGQQGLAAAAGEPALTAELEMDVAYYFASVGDVPSAVVHAHLAVAAAEQAGSPALLADTIATSVVSECMAGLGIDEERIARARMLEDPQRPRAWQMSPAFIHGNLLLYGGHPDEALTVLGTLHVQSRERGEESVIPFSCFWLTWASLWRGDFAQARDFADEARQTAALLDDPAAQGMALSASALVHAHDGSTDRARLEALEAVQLFGALGWTFGVVYALWALGVAELTSGNPAGVDRALGPVALQLTAFPGDPFVGAFLAQEIEALVELGQLDRAEPLLRWLEQRALALDRPWARAVAGRCRGLLCSADGDSAAALAAVDLALVQHARNRMPFERARTLLVKGRIHRRRKEKRLAAGALEEALRAFCDVGAPQWAATTQAELDRLGRRPSTADELTATERRVAELAAAGMANREIAERAFLTTKAVEANLTRVYRKLGIRSRGGLARALPPAGDARTARVETTIP